MGIIEKVVKQVKILGGKGTKDKVYSSKSEYPGKEAALRAFERSKAKLFNVNKWSDLPGLTSTFELYTSSGKPAGDREPQKGDYIRIMLPLPAPENWVVVTDIRQNNEMAQFTVSPSRDPREGGEDIEHFFIDEATSTFKITLNGQTLYAYEIGKNEGINNQGTDAGKRELINTLVAEGGWIFFQKIQWRQLTDYLVHKIEAKS
ncbi:hypothetical protein [Nafulsella turpanensis]|uniref:hypothetical protein n=1 Tax=Nafulsella turpanensis TaxID=1265690 RepID=UPI0003458458|nr:hypothetical protein [Nafulsella turpanensis]